jgi:hemin uptake protein HemP
MQAESDKPRQSATAACPPSPRTLVSNELFGTAREVRIVHNGEQYTLRVTRLGKLILTK